MKRFVLGQGLASLTAMVVTLSLLSGCGQQTFLSKEVYEISQKSMLPPKLEDDPCKVTAPITDIVKAPATVVLPDRRPRYLSLQEALAISLENGNVGATGPGGPGAGTANNLPGGFPGPGSLNGGTERVRVLALNPALTGSAMEGALARFDADWITSMSWTNTDALAGVPNLPGYLGEINNQTAQFQSSIIKAFSGGGVANVSFLADYRNLNNSAGNPLAFGNINPEYSVRASFGFEQPLWRDWGTEINQLLSHLPSITGNSITSLNGQIGYQNQQGRLGSFSDRGPSEGILISRLRFDQSRAEFERNIHILMVNAEVAYWTLYNKYGQLYSFEENLRILRKGWEESYHQWKAGKLAAEVYYQVLGQFEEFRGERTRAMEEILDAERQLRTILGMVVEDGERLVPITPPSLVELRPDWDTCLHEALTLRPELQLARDNLKYHQYLLQIQKNNIKPDLRAFMRYEPFGDGSTLQGNGTYLDSNNTAEPANAIKSLSTGHLADWQIGVYLNVPIGFRFEHAAIRAARLELSQAYYFLRDMEDRCTRALAEQYQELSHFYMRIQNHRSERLAYQESLRILGEKIRVGSIQIGGASTQVLQIQRSYAAALVKEYQAISDYNSTLARLEWVKGTILRYDHIHIGEGQLPQMVAVRATEYEKDRSRACVLRERPDSLSQPGRMCLNDSDHGIAGIENGPPPQRFETIPSIPMKAETKVEMPREARPISVPLEGKPVSMPVESKPAPVPAKLPEVLSPGSDKTKFLVPISAVEPSSKNGLVTADDSKPFKATAPRTTAQDARLHDAVMSASYQSLGNTEPNEAKWVPVAPMNQK